MKSISKRYNENEKKTDGEEKGGWEFTFNMNIDDKILAQKGESRNNDVAEVK